MSEADVTENQIDPENDQAAELETPEPAAPAIETDEIAPTQPDTDHITPSKPGKRKYVQKGGRSEGQKASLIKARIARQQKAVESRKIKEKQQKMAHESKIRDDSNIVMARQLSQVLDPFVELTHAQNKLLKQAYGRGGKRKRRYYESSSSESEDEFEDEPPKKSAPKQQATAPKNPYGIDGPLQRTTAPKTAPNQKAPASGSGSSNTQMYSFMKGLGF